MELQDMEGATIFLVQLLLLFTSSVEGKNIINNAELELMTKLFPKPPTSMKDVLPVKSDDSPVKVDLGLAVRQIMDIDEKNQVIILSMWFRQYWNNPMLTWNPIEYDNISSVNIDKNLVWVPDICLYNTAEDTNSLYQRLDTKIIVSNDGNCTWLAPIILKSECKIDVKFFPFDEQFCNLTFGSWTYNGKRIDVKPKEKSADLRNYVKNGEWKMIRISAERQVEYFPCCPEPYPYVTYVVHMRRRILYYVSNLIVPCGIIAALAFLSFYLPVESGERISLVITVLLAMTVYMLMVSNSMPPTSEVIPLIGKYYLAVMIEIALCLVATCITIKWHHNATPMPRWVHYIFVRFLGSVLCIKRTKMEKPLYEVSSGRMSYSINHNQRSLAEIKPNKSSVQLKEITNTSASAMESIHNDITLLSNKVEFEKTEEEIGRDWKTAAEVLDRLFFVIFFVMFVLVSVIMFASIPKHND